MTNEEIVKLYQQTEDKARRKELLEQLIKANEGIIHDRAWYYHNTKAFNQQPSISLEDLKQEAMTAFRISAKTYDFNKGAQFITYVCNAIEWRIIRCLTKCWNKNYREVSLQTPIGSKEDELTLGDTISDEDSFIYKKNPYDAVNDEIFCHQIREQADEIMRIKLTLQEQVILKMYVGWVAEPATFEEIGKTLFISGSYASNIKDNACRKLRMTTWAKELKREFYKDKTIRKFIKRHDNFKDNEKWENSGRGAEEFIKALLGEESWEWYKKYREELEKAN